MGTLTIDLCWLSTTRATIYHFVSTFENGELGRIIGLLDESVTDTIAAESITLPHIGRMRTAFHEHLGGF